MPLLKELHSVRGAGFYKYFAPTGRGADAATTERGSAKKAKAEAFAFT